MLQRHFLPRPPRCPRGADHKLAEGRRACRRQILSEGARLTGARRSGGCRSGPHAWQRATDKFVGRLQQRWSNICKHAANAM